MKKENKLKLQLNKNQTLRMNSNQKITSAICAFAGVLPVLPANICGYRPDQIAFFVPDALVAKRYWENQGHDKWIVDTVTAQAIDPNTNKVTEFKVQLCFNYNIMPCEFELISVLEGTTVQIPFGPLSTFSGHLKSGLSHIGFHVENIEQAIADFSDFPVLSRIRTLHHSGCNHIYDYVFVNTQVLGFITKLIRRIK